MVSIMKEGNLGEVKRGFGVRSLAELAELTLYTNWAPALFKENKRNNESFATTSLLVLDVDEGLTLEEAKLLFKEYRHAICTSKSHQVEKNGKIGDRFRVIIPLSRIITSKEEYSSTWAEAYKRWPFIDKSCKDPARFYYISKEVIEVVEEGREIDPVTPEPREVEPVKLSAPSGEKGLLSRKTLEFLTFGAPSGQRHARLVEASGDMRDQGYTEEEAIDLVERMAKNGGDWTQSGLNEKDLATIKDMFKREHKFSIRLKEENHTKTVRAIDLLEEALDYIGDKEKVKGDSTGIEGLDHMLGGGFRTGELTVLMAQAKTGKNSFYHYLIYHMIANRGLSVGYASRELTPSTEVIPNLLSIATGNNAWKQEVDAGYRTLSAKIVGQWPLYFADGYGYFPPREIEEWLRSMKQEGVNHFFIDHLHYLLKGEDYESTAELVKLLKSLTKELDIHINLIVQPRSLREGEKLSLATLRGGAAIGQALDNLLILERVRGEAMVSKLSLEVARHKLAKPNHIYLQYDPDSTAFQEVDKMTVSPTPEGLEDYQRGGSTNRRWPRYDN